MERIDRLRQRLRGARTPTETLSPVCIAPIGIVASPVRDPRRRDWSAVRASIEVLAARQAALTGLDGFSHAIVVTWLHHVSAEERQIDAIHPAGDPALPRIGVLALRTHHRPNPIGVTVVRIERVEAARVIVRGLDVVDGTPVLDIKPYIAVYDSVPDARLPAWADERR